MAENRQWHPNEAVPYNLSKYTPKKREITHGDVYVSPNGNDNADGSFEKPFATLERARNKIRASRARQNNKDKAYTVSILEGNYCLAEGNSLVLNEQDSNTRYTAYNNNEVCFNGSIRIPDNELLPIAKEDKMRAIFPAEAVDHIFCTDISKYPQIAECLGEAKSDRPYEILINGRRAQLPRYPESSSLKTGAIVNDSEYKGAGGIFTVDSETKKRINAWHKLTSVSVDGYFCVDWRHSRLPIENYDSENGLITTAFVDSYGLAENCPYFFINVPDEMRTPNTYYIDSERGLLYVYPSEAQDKPSVEISVRNEPFIRIDGANNITLEGLTFKNSRATAISFNGDRITIKACTVENIYEDAIDGEGIHNTVSECEIAHVGKSGINLRAGDKPTLTNGYATVDNCSIHGWGEINRTGVHAVSIVGVHNRVSHNELYDAPYRAIHYSGQEHLIEYNYIHDVVQGTGDMGATYSGFHWDSQGCVLRYNCICNVGNEKYGANGIYWDDMLGGQTGYGNILINVAGHGFMIGGGRDHLAYNNIVLNPGAYPLLYDQRGCDWEKGFALNKSCAIWQNLYSVPFRSEKWKNKFSTLARITEEPDFDDPNFPPTPANSRITRNVFISIEDCYVMEQVMRFSNIGDNVKMDIDDDPGFADREHGDYTFLPDSPVFDKIPSFENLPFEKMGRY